MSTEVSATNLVEISSPFGILEWMPSATRERIRDAPTGKKVEYRDVTEVIRVIIQDGDVNDNFAELEKVKRALAYAPYSFKDPTAPRYYIGFRETGAADWWISRLISGRADEGPATLQVDWITDRLFARITYTREYYWEQYIATLLDLTNQGGTSTAQGIVNHADAAHDNYVEIAAADLIRGDLEAPILLKFVNGEAGVTYRNIYTCSWTDYGGDIAYITNVQADDGVMVGGISAVQADAGASNGEYVEATWAVDAETKLFTYKLDDLLLKTLKGASCRIIQKFWDAPPASPPLIRLKVVYGSELLWEGDQVQMTVDELQDLGQVKLPPWDIWGKLDTPDLLLEVWCQKVGGDTLNFDFIQPMPAKYFRLYRPLGDGLVYDVDDAWLEDHPTYGVFTWNDSAAAADKGAIPNYIGSGRLIEFVPDEKHRMYFLWDRADGTAPIDDIATISIRWRARRKTLDALGVA
jgi:hypothetical protein